MMRKITECTYQVSKNNTTQKLFITMAWSLALLYRVPRRLLNRGQNWMDGKGCCYGEINSVQKLYDHTTQNMNDTQVWEPSCRLENLNECVWHSEVDVWKDQHICTSLGTEIICKITYNMNGNKTSCKRNLLRWRQVVNST